MQNTRTSRVAVELLLAEREQLLAGIVAAQERLAVLRKLLGSCRDTDAGGLSSDQLPDALAIAR